MVDGAGGGAGEKAAFRAWARQNHPDVGGDPTVFAAGVQAQREGRWNEFTESADGPKPPPQSRPTVYMHRSARGLAKVIVAAQRWNAGRRRPPRVQ